MRIKIYPKSLFGYCGIIALFRFISLFVDANLGTTLLVSFCVMLSLSIILLIINFGFISINGTNADIKVLKNEMLNYRIRVTSKLPICFCFVEIKMKAQEYLEIHDKDYYVSMVDRETPIQADFKYKAGVFGVDILGIDYIMIRDFMGVMALRKNIKADTINVKTLPRYVENYYDRNIMIFSKYMADFDDSEEVNGTLTTTSGVPGYEHREFVEGDSLKRVNYKMSAKRDKLMVRLDEPSSTLRQAVILDNISSNDRYMDEIAIEGLMSYVGCLMNNKITTEVYFNANGKKHMFTVTNERDLGVFVDLISNTVFYDSTLIKDSEFINSYTIYKSNRLSSVVVFSPTGSRAVKIIENLKLPYHIITPDKKAVGDNIFYIDENLSITAGGVRDERNER